MDEPNVVNDAEDMQEEPDINNSPPQPPKHNLRATGRKVINGTANITRKILEIVASMPLPVKIGIAVVIAIIIIVVVILKAEASESTDAFTDSMDEVISKSEDISDEALESYERSGSLIKFPIAKLLEMYEHFANEGEFSGQDIRDNYNYILGTNEVTYSNGSSSSSSNSNLSADIVSLVQKAVEMSKKGGIAYGSNGRQLASTLQELDSLTKTDCSGFVWSLFKSILGIDVGAGSEGMLSYANQKHSENGWTATLYDIGDGSGLQPGDILYRSGHVGLYVGSYGENNHVDHGGPSSGPKNTNYENKATKYTHYIRYTKS